MLTSRFRNDDTNKNDVFAVTYAGIGKTGKHEYHIINNNSGTYMASPDKAPQVVPLTGEVLSPSKDRTRWSVSICHLMPCNLAADDCCSTRSSP
jgi:hypothetical protein